MSKKSLFTLLLIAVVAQLTFGQAAKSPFSSFGVGEPFSSALVNNQGMGGVGIGTPQHLYLNNQNPALLVYNYLTTLGTGFIGEQRTVRNGKVSEKNSNGNLSYLTMAFPIIGPPKKANTTRWTSSFALLPYSTVNYKLIYTASLEGTSGTMLVTETGSGGIDQAVWANGFTINKYLSVGVKSRYLFGSKIEQFSNFLNQAPVYQPNIYQRERYSDINFSGGLSFHTDSLTSKNLRFNLGLIYEMKTNVKTTYFSSLQRISGGNAVDTVVIVDNEVGNTVLPPSAGVGISIGKNGWIIGADVVFTDYTQFKNYFGSSQNTQSTMHYAVGAQVSPYSGVTANYFNRMIYRIGASYDEFPFLVNNAPAKDIGINLGLGLPVAGFSSLDIGVKFGKRGEISTNRITEDYFKIYFGATFNDRWFIKRRYE